MKLIKAANTIRKNSVMWADFTMLTFVRIELSYWCIMHSTRYHIFLSLSSNSGQQVLDIGLKASQRCSYDCRVTEVHSYDNPPACSPAPCHIALGNDNIEIIDTVHRCPPTSNNNTTSVR